MINRGPFLAPARAERSHTIPHHDRSRRPMTNQFLTASVPWRSESVGVECCVRAAHTDVSALGVCQ